jgi:hypothetical protein
MNRKTLMILLCLAGSAAATAGCGGGESSTAAARPAASAAPAASKPVKIALQPKHRSKVTGTAELVPAGGATMTVTLTLDKQIAGPLMAHIHTGPCSDEPTMSNPRIWAMLEDLRDSRSETTVNTVTLKELQSEPSSINVHDPTHGNRPLVCADIPRAG